MRISVNLASRPFVELRPLFARLRIAMAVLGLIAIGLAFGLQSLRAKADVATAQMSALRVETNRVEQQRVANETRMRRPENKSVLDRSTFLNALFARKSFSWTAVMMDLERVLPSSVQVTSIEPVISKEGDVLIRLRVTGDRDRAILLVRNLETSRHFVMPRLSGETALSAEKANALGRAPQAAALRTVNGNLDEAFGNGVEFEIFSGYTPVSAAETKRVEPKRVEPKRTAVKSSPRAKGKAKVAPVKPRVRREQLIVRKRVAKRGRRG
jgi:type IV pilus assembly protein PilN